MSALGYGRAAGGNRLSWVAVAIAAVLLAPASIRAAGPDQVKPFNAAELKTVLEQNKGQVVLFDFWATWCAPCRKEIPQLVDLHKRLAAKGFHLVTVSADEEADKAAALEFLQQTGVPSPAYIKSVDDDDAFIEALNPHWSGALPALFLYDRKGQLAEMWVGETEISTIEKALAGLL